MERLLNFSPGLAIGMTAAITYAFFALLLIALDRFRPSSTSKDDTQVELKVLLFALALIGLALAAGGVTDLVAIIAGGFKGGGDAIKHVLAPIVVGGGVMAAMLVMFSRAPTRRPRAAPGARCSPSVCTSAAGDRRRLRVHQRPGCRRRGRRPRAASRC
jgi:hypothetical protein